MKSMQNKKFISAREAAAYLGVGYRTFLNMVKGGMIPYICPNGKMRKYDIVDLEEYMNGCKVNAKLR